MKTLKELNAWSKRVWGINFPCLLVLFCVVEWAISRMPT